MTRRAKNILALVVLMALIAVIWMADAYRNRLPPIPEPSDARALKSLPVIPVELPDGTRIAAEVAWTEHQKETGLMYRSIVPPQTGLLIVHDKNDYQQIWMKNTFVNLDVIFIDADKRIVVVHPDVPAAGDQKDEDRIATRTGYGKYVLEMATGEAHRLQIEKGMKLDFTLAAR
ncbi:DUF192 domain-containing protein [bacterium]|nr:DUF192 domain-containing protein [candidate division CSSED10-310 bacterium]